MQNGTGFELRVSPELCLAELKSVSKDPGQLGSPSSEIPFRR